MPDNKDQQVIIYKTPTCAFCHTEQQWLESLGVTNVVLRDIETDPSAREELVQKTNGDFRGVPITDIDGQMIVGFDRPRLTEALKTAGLIAA